MLVTDGREGVFCGDASGSPGRKPMSIHEMEKWKGGGWLDACIEG